MQTTKRYCCLFILLLSTTLLFAQAENKSFIEVTGEVKTPLKIFADDLLKMKRTDAVLTDRDSSKHTYSGVAIIDLLNKAGVTTGKELRGENLSKYLLVKCADNYTVLFSLAEIDTSFTDKLIILADKIDGDNLDANKGPFRLIVPGERKPARSAYQVVEFRVKFAKD